MNKHVRLNEVRTSPSALELFRAGKDTVEIGKLLGLPESAASRRIHLERCEEMGVPPAMEQAPRRPNFGYVQHPRPMKGDRE